MPPLVYDANAKVQPEIDPRMIILVRRVRVRPTLIFQGRVEGVAVAAVTPPPTAATNSAKPAALAALPSLIVCETSSASCGPAASDL